VWGVLGPAKGAKDDSRELKGESLLWAEMLIPEKKTRGASGIVTLGDSGGGEQDP